MTTAQLTLAPESPAHEWVRENQAKKRELFESIPGGVWRDYMACYDALTDAGKYPYNSEFEGIPGADSHLIYLCQCRRRDEEALEEREWYADNGYRNVERGEPGKRVKFTEIVLFRSGERKHYDDARIGYDDQGVASFILPKGKRTRGYRVEWNTSFGGSSLGIAIFAREA